MSLFPVLGGHAPAQAQANQPISDNPAGWLSNNASYQPHDVLEPRPPYGKYATQAEFLRAAERYLESSSESDAEGDHAGAGAPSAAATAAAAKPPVTSTGAAAAAQAATRQDKRERGAHGRPSRRHRSQSPSGGSSSGSSDTDGSGGRNHKKRKRHRHRSSSRSPSRSKRSRKQQHGGKGSDRPDPKSKSSKRRRRKHRRRSGSSSSSSGDDSSSDGGGAAAASERAKILRLERAAAAAGLAPRQAAALTAGAKPVLKGAASQPGDMFYDTRGDLENLVYECLYGSNVASYHRVDPLGLAKGARARRILPGQVGGGDGDGDGGMTRGSVLLAGRYFGARSVAAERSRRLRRVFLAEAPVLPGTHRSRNAVAADGGGGGGEAGVRRGWLVSQLEPPAAAAAAARGRAGASELGGGGGFRMAMPLPSYLPLQDPTAAAAAAAAGGGAGWERRVGPSEAQAAMAAAAAGGESAEEWVLRRTREFNVAVREAPQDVKLWLRFASFQDTVTRLLARRGGQVEGSAADKKLAILQRALEAHPGHPVLLRAMMAASEPLLEPEGLMDRWDRLLRRTPGDPALWRDYLARRRSTFATTKLSRLQVAYGDALHALASERARRQRQAAAAPAAEHPAAAAAVLDLDRELVRLVLELLDLELGAGAGEVAVARVQALIEFHCFAPGSLDTGAAAGAGSGPGGGGLRLSAGALLRLFDNFWESGAARAGEEGARGWASWYRKENEALWVAKSGGDGGGGVGRRRGDPEDDGADPRDGGGWTGWMELPPPAQQPQQPQQADSGVAVAAAAAAAGTEAAAAAAAAGNRDGKGEGEDDEDEEEEGEAAEEEGVQLTEEELLAQLGLRLDEQLEEMQRQGVPPDILTRWLRTERQRSARDWRPLRPPPTHGSPQQPPDDKGEAANADGGGGHAAAADAADALRVVLLEDIRDGIFPIEDPDLRLDLALGCLCLLGVPLTAPAAGAGAVPLLSSCVGCCSQSFIRLLPQRAAVAALQGCLPPSMAAAAAAACGGGGIAAPWYLADESRRVFVARLLRALLVDGPYGDQPQLALAYLLVEAAQAYDTGVDAESDAPVPPQLARVDRGREAARELLSSRRSSLALLMALAAVEEAAGQPWAARRARDAALAGAAALPPEEQRLLPLLVHQYAEAERAAAAAAAATCTAAGTAGAEAALLEPALRAHHVLRWFLAAWLPARGAGGGSGAAAAVVPYTPYKAGRQVTREDLAAARRGFESRVPSLLSAQGGFLDAASASCLYLGGLLEAFTASLFPSAAAGAGGGGGLAAALTVHKNAAAAVPAAVRQASGFHEALAVSYCGLVVSELGAAAAAGGGGGVQPARARMALLQALELYPHNPQLLALRLQLGGRLAAGRCRLRRDMAGLAAALRRRAEGSLEALADSLAEAEGTGLGPSPATASAAAAAVWWAQLASEADHSLSSPIHGSVGSGLAASDPRVARLLERAAAARHLAPCASVWTAYLSYEAAAGRRAAAKRVFLRAVREVPLSKQLWMMGLALLGQGGGGGDGVGTEKVDAAAVAGLLSSREVSELMGVAADKGVRLRTDVYEVMLEHLAEQQ